MPRKPQHKGEKKSKYGHVLLGVEAQIPMDDGLVWQCTNCGVRSRNLYGAPLRDNTCDK